MKKTLLIAAAALVAGIVSSNAQVYSANVVGYVNTVSQPGVFSLVANPLDNGAGNVLSNTIVAAPGATVVQTWDPVGGAFTAYKLQAGHWKNVATSANADNVAIPPGVGFFITPAGSAPYTNTFVGSVLVAAGASTTNTVNTGLQLVASQIPYSGPVNSASFNLTVAGATTLQQWDPVGQAFVPFKFQAGSWKNLNTSLVQVPSIAVGEGFFLSPPTVPNVWVQTLP